MIEFDLVEYLLTDAALKALIGWGATNPKIYPDQAPAKVATPYILYEWGTGDTTDELLDEDRIQLTIVDTDRINIADIRDRLKVLLDKQDGIQGTAFYTGSANHFIYWSKITAGSSVMETETSEISMVLACNVKIKNKIP